MILNYFNNCGLTIATDGSEDDICLLPSQMNLQVSFESSQN